MQDDLIAPLDPAEVQRAAQGITADLLRVARNDSRKLIAATLACLLGASIAVSYGKWPLGLFFIVVIVAVFLNLQKTSHRRQMGVALPFVLRTLGLEHTVTGMEFNRSLPARLFPRVGDPLVANVFSGAVDGCPVAIAEIEVKDRTDDSDKPIFDGLVLRVDLPTVLPDFLILEEALSRKLKGQAAGTWFFNKPAIDVGFLQRSQAFPPGSHGLGLWLSPSGDLSAQPLSGVLKVLSYPPDQARMGGRLHSAANSGGTIFIALRASTATMVRTAEASATRAGLAIHATYDWLAQPLVLAKALIRAARA